MRERERERVNARIQEGRETDTNNSTPENKSLNEKMMKYNTKVI